MALSVGDEIIPSMQLDVAIQQLEEMAAAVIAAMASVDDSGASKSATKKLAPPIIPPKLAAAGLSAGISRADCERAYIKNDRNLDKTLSKLADFAAGVGVQFEVKCGYEDACGIYGVDPTDPKRNGAPWYRRMSPDGTFYSTGHKSAGFLSQQDNGRWRFWGLGGRNNFPYDSTEAVTTPPTGPDGWKKNETMGSSPLPTLSWFKFSDAVAPNQGSHAGTADSNGSENEVEDVDADGSLDWLMSVGDGRGIAGCGPLLCQYWGRGHHSIGDTYFAAQDYANAICSFQRAWNLYGLALSSNDNSFSGPPLPVPGGEAESGTNSESLAVLKTRASEWKTKLIACRRKLFDSWKPDKLGIGQSTVDAAVAVPAFSMPFGIQLMIPNDYLSGWTVAYDIPYDKCIKEDQFDSIDPTATHVFIGARNPEGEIALGATGERDVVLSKTKKNEPHEHNGVWWYYTPETSIGFAPNGKIHQSNADTEDRSSSQRLSWHLTSGGWRAGSKCDSPSGWSKLVCYRTVGTSSKELDARSRLTNGNSKLKAKATDFTSCAEREPHSACLTIGDEATILHKACAKGDVDLVLEALKSKPDPHAVDVRGRTPFFIACGAGHLEVVEMMSWAGLGVGDMRPDSSGRSPYLAACLGGHKEVVESLLEMREGAVCAALESEINETKKPAIDEGGSAKSEAPGLKSSTHLEDHDLRQLVYDVTELSGTVDVPRSIYFSEGTNENMNKSTSQKFVNGDWVMVSASGQSFYYNAMTLGPDGVLIGRQFFPSHDPSDAEFHVRGRVVGNSISWRCFNEGREGNGTDCAGTLTNNGTEIVNGTFLASTFTGRLVTASPKAAPLPLEASRYFITTEAKVNVRRTPSLDAQKVGCIDHSDPRWHGRSIRVQEVSPDGLWLKIVVADCLLLRGTTNYVELSPVEMETQAWVVRTSGATLDGDVMFTLLPQVDSKPRSPSGEYLRTDKMRDGRPIFRMRSPPCANTGMDVVSGASGGPKPGTYLCIEHAGVALRSAPTEASKTKEVGAKHDDHVIVTAIVPSPCGITYLKLQSGGYLPLSLEEDVLFTRLAHPVHDKGPSRVDADDEVTANLSRRAADAPGYEISYDAAKEMWEVIDRGTVVRLSLERENPGIPWGIEIVRFYAPLPARRLPISK